VSIHLGIVGCREGDDRRETVSLVGEADERSFFI
jgi:hypothetical protein